MNIADQIERSAALTRAIQEAIIAQSPQYRDDALIAMVGIGPTLRNKFHIREFADRSRDYLIRTTREEQKKPEVARVAEEARPINSPPKVVLQ
jgi:hypothetical protein